MSELTPDLEQHDRVCYRVTHLPDDEGACSCGMGDHFVRDNGGHFECDCGDWSSRTLDRESFAAHVSVFLAARGGAA